MSARDSDWLTRAMALLAAGQAEQAEALVSEAVAGLGGPPEAEVARLHAAWARRLLADGRAGDARRAAARAMGWMRGYAAGATSGGEGAARSLEVDDFQRELADLLEPRPTER